MVDFPRLPDLPSPADQPLESAGVWKRTWYEWLRVTDKIVRTVAPSASDLEGRLDDLSGELDDAFDDTRGSILYRGASGWAALGPGTAGHRLQTNGAGADPTWEALPTKTWTLIESRAASGSDETFTDLGGYRDLQIILDRVTTSSSGSRRMEVSSDNGSTWATVILDGFGDTALVNIALISTTATSAERSCSIVIFGWGTTMPAKTIKTTINTPNAIISGSAMNALRISNSAGNLNGGTIHLMGIPN